MLCFCMLVKIETHEFHEQGQDNPASIFLFLVWLIETLVKVFWVSIVVQWINLNSIEQLCSENKYRNEIINGTGYDDDDDDG